MIADNLGLILWVIASIFIVIYLVEFLLMYFETKLLDRKLTRIEYETLSKLYRGIRWK